MYGQGGGFNPHYRHAAPPPPPLSQQPLPPPPSHAGVTGGFPQQPLPPPPPLSQYQQPPAMRPPPGPYQHGVPPQFQNQGYPYPHPGQMHHMPMLPQQRGFGHMPMPGPPPSQAMYQAPPQYPMSGPLPPPPPRPPSIAPDDLPPPPPPSPPLVAPSPPAAPTAAQSRVEPEGAPDAGRDGKSEKAATDLIVSDDSDMDMGGDEDSPSRVNLSAVNSSPAAAECSGDVNAPKAVNDTSGLGNDLPPGSTGKSKMGNVTVEAGSQLQLIQQGYASDDSEDEGHTGASSNPLLLPEDNKPSHPSDRNTEIGHLQVTNAEENVNAAPSSAQNNESRLHELKDERNPIKHSSGELGHPVKENLSGSESAGMQQSERHGRIQMKRSRDQSPQAGRSRSPSRGDEHSPSRSSSPGRQSKSPVAKRANLHQSKSSHQVSLLPGQPLLASSEFPQAQFQPNAVAPANDFLKNQMRTYPAPDLSHPRPLDFHPHTLQPVVPCQQQPATFLADEFKRPYSLDSAPVPLQDGRPEYSGGVGLSYSHQSSYGPQQPPPGSLASGANIAYPSFPIFPSNLPGSSDFIPAPDAILPKSSIKPHYNPFASTFETDPTLDIGPVLSPNAVASASARAGEHMNTLNHFSQSAAGSGTRFIESSAEVVPNRQKQSRPGFTSTGPYDPLLDSIEPSGNSIDKDIGQEANLSATGSRNASKLVNIEVESKNMQGLGLVAESEVGELGEVAADTETGVVENVSPEPLGAKDWSSDIPGDIDNDQSLDVSKKSKDSRSMKLFKAAIADFVKEVLKPSWRQGNMSREAFKMIVKKTVDKVANSVPSNHIPKTPAKIKQYVQSSQRKVTKLVMGYVERYVKL